jgi:hypothetical protein
MTGLAMIRLSSQRPVTATLGKGFADALACLFVLLTLLAPNNLSRLAVGVFVSVPLEALVGVAILLLLPVWARPAIATLFGVAVGLLALMKLLDMGLLGILGRPFNPVVDWGLLEDGMRFLAGAIGALPAIGCLAAVVVFSTVVIIVMTWSVQRLSRSLARHDAVVTRTVIVVAALWLAAAVLEIQVVPGVPLASESSAMYLKDRGLARNAEIRGQQESATLGAADPFASTPSDELLTALRGKDVIVCFVESYGRSAVEDPEFAPGVNAVLDAGNQQLRSRGFDSRSAFLTSSTLGGGSWLAHGTFLSGLWTDSQQLYDELQSSQRLTLTRAFRRAGWRTVAVMPGNDAPWQQSEFLGYDRAYDAKDLGYRGPRFSWASMPDQYTLFRFERTEHAATNRQPVMAEITLVSSHAPWEPVPRLVDWTNMGDGSVFDGMARTDDPPQAILTRPPGRVQADYGVAIEYSLSSLISYVQTYGDKNLVLIVLGDHQPSPIVTGYGVSRDVPISIVTQDQSVLNRISSWGWHDGLKPGPQAPVWRMDAFRDRFLTAFGPQNDEPVRHRHSAAVSTSRVR